MPFNDTTIDVQHLGRRQYVAVELLATSAGPVLLDTGPGSTLDTLEAGLAAAGTRVEALHAVLLSHIHFDHAGATGLLVERNPNLIVYVHERGARHLADPTKLVASATRIYGDRMDSLWGRFLPVPPANLRSLTGGETVRLGNREFAVAATPGHASHHVGYYEAATSTAYVGDTGGLHVPALPITLPVTPPPDFDLEAWLSSLDQIASWAPARLFCTHYGFSNDVAAHLADLRRGLAQWTTLARDLLSQDLSDDARADQFHRTVLAGLEGQASPEAIAAFSSFADFRASYHGIARYWQKRLTQPSPTA